MLWEAITFPSAMYESMKLVFLGKGIKARNG